jgi:hypothetical protein
METGVVMCNEKRWDESCRARKTPDATTVKSDGYKPDEDSRI